MHFHILTLFPEMVLQGLNTSIIGRAVKKNIISIEAVNIRDYTLNKQGQVDDYPYGGGAGILMQAQPVYDAWRAVVERAEGAAETGLPQKAVRTIYVTPQGQPFTQKLAQELAREEELIFLCGHYEGIDERVLEEIVTDYISIGDYVLTGGELPAMVMTDAIARLVPGVLHNEFSAETESFHNDLLEYPQYSRPEVWHGKAVPKILLSGNHREVTKWRLQQAEERTRAKRPDLYQIYEKKQAVIKRLSKNKRNNIHMMENLARGRGEVLFAEGNNILVYDRSCRMGMLTVESREMGQRALACLGEDCSAATGHSPQSAREVKRFVTSQEFMNAPVCERLGLHVQKQCWQVCYTRREMLPVKHKDIRRLDLESLDDIREHYWLSEDDIVDRLEAGAMYGAFAEGRLVGFIGIHDDGSTGLLYVEEAFRRTGLGASLQSFMINRQMEWGWTPYGHIMVGNDKSLELSEKLGLYCAKDTLWWLEM